MSARDDGHAILHQLGITLALLRCVQAKLQDNKNGYGSDEDLALDAVIDRLDAEHERLDEFLAINDRAMRALRGDDDRDCETFAVVDGHKDDAKVLDMFKALKEDLAARKTPKAGV